MCSSLTRLWSGHMTVAEGTWNSPTPLRKNRQKPNETSAFNRILDIVGLGDKRDRSATRL